MVDISKNKKKSVDYNKLIVVEQHFHSNYHDLTDEKFTMIIRIEKENVLNNITVLSEAHEDEWINRL